MMKFPTILLSSLLATATISRTAAASTHEIGRSNTRRMNMSRSATQNLVQQARRLDQNNAGGDNESFVQLYSLKLIKCLSDQEVVNQNTGETDYSLVIFRLCPKDSCDSDSTGGCDGTNSADYAVGLNTFVQSFLQDQEDNMNQGDDQDNNFALEDYAECAKYEPEDNDDGSYFYLGPMCSSNEIDITIGVYDDQYCSQKSESAFEDISGGWSLPYDDDGGFVSTSCIPCAEWNDNDDQADGQEYELRELCDDMYTYANYRCEAPDFTSHYYWDAITEVNRFGADQTGCNNINGWEMKRKPTKTNWGEVFLLLILVAGSVAGGVYYNVWWNEQAENLELIDDDDTEVGDDTTARSGLGDDETAPETDPSKVDAEVSESQQHVPMKDATFA